jgi:hypothetical protein
LEEYASIDNTELMVTANKKIYVSNEKHGLPLTAKMPLQLKFTTLEL